MSQDSPEETPQDVERQRRDETLGRVVGQLTARLAEMQQAALDATEARAAAEARIAALEAERDAAQAAARAAEARLEEIAASTSWRITAPLRRIAGRLGRR